MTARGHFKQEYFSKEQKGNSVQKEASVLLFDDLNYSTSLVMSQLKLPINTIKKPDKFFLLLSGCSEEIWPSHGCCPRTAEEKRLLASSSPPVTQPVAAAR